MMPANQTPPHTAAEPNVPPAFLVMDAESVPDGRLLRASSMPGTSSRPRTLSVAPRRKRGRSPIRVRTSFP